MLPYVSYDLTGTIWLSSY